MKKSQITIFIVIGIVIFILVFSLFYIRSFKTKTKTKTEVEKISEPPLDFTPIDIFVKSCIAKVTKPLITELGLNGGTLNLNSDIYYKGDMINVLCDSNTQYYCINKLLLRQDMEKELNQNITNNIKKCLNFSIYEKRGFNITTNDLTVNTTIRNKDIFVNLHYPLLIKRGNDVKTFEDFYEILNLPFNKLYGLAIDILNKEAKYGFFDKDEWVLKHGAEIIIEKHKQYPDIIYILRKEFSPKDKYEFRFAVKDIETVGEIIITKPLQQLGCCINKRDGFCFKNIEQNQCNRAFLTYNSSPDCNCNPNINFQKKGCCVKNDLCEFTSENECVSTGGNYYDDPYCNANYCRNLDCFSTFNYVDNDYTLMPRKHGESWCIYDARAGKGFDYVGSRHYLHSCFNGIEIIEECRDYREEICTSNNITVNNEVYSKAKCRLNRWYDCFNQRNRDDCEDKRYRDCFWREWERINKKCSPEVPPGLKFWQGNGLDICNKANENKRGSARRYPRSFGYSALKLCQSMGDCSNYRNILDTVTELGFFNPDGDSATLIREANINYIDIYNQYNWPDYGTLQQIYLELDNNNLSADVDFPQDAPESFTRCDLWQAPLTGDYCNLCNETKYKPCTEYKCKSLGRFCSFIYNKGNSYCIRNDSIIIDNNPPEIRLDIDAWNTSYNLTSHITSNSIEYEVIPNLTSHTPFSFGVIVNEPARCWLSIVPRDRSVEIFNDPELSNVQLPDIYLSDSNFRTKHNTTIMFMEPIFETDYLSIYNLFVRCRDYNFNQNTRKFMIKFNINKTINDINPPFILGSYPEPNTIDELESFNLELFVNEPFNDCRYSANEDKTYNNMTPIGCSTNELNITYTAGVPIGSYMCETDITRNFGDDAFYFKCEDLSENIAAESYVFNMSQEIIIV